MQPGRFAEGPRNPGLYPARLRSERVRNALKQTGRELNFLLLFRAQKFVALDGRYDTHGT